MVYDVDIELTRDEFDAWDNSFFSWICRDVVEYSRFAAEHQQARARAAALCEKAEHQRKAIDLRNEIDQMLTCG
jgi:hypothetical protein